jgi:capsular polysaccharide export protein
VTWGRSADADLARATESGRLPNDTVVLRLEDGFLRSAGLGAGLVPPISWVVDPVGIYYDATAPSALERILLAHPFPAPLLERSRRLLERILSLNLTKYNVGTGGWTPPATSRPIFLVPGQVEFDASLRYGAQTVRTNLALLEAVRNAHPEAFLLYKPHPDVLAGLRAQGPHEAQAMSACDLVVRDVAMGEILGKVDEVHVMTSLTGFEALLRGKTVVCYGAPFYAGWGLTEDSIPVNNRGRRLSLEQLVAAALLLYPRYLHPETNRLIEAEEALEILRRARERNSVMDKHSAKAYFSRVFYTIVGFYNRLNDLKRARPL